MSDITERLRMLGDLVAQAAADEIDRLRNENFTLAANQCKAGYSGEHGDHMCLLEQAAKEMRSDYMTSEGHHPGYVLVPTAAFRKLQAALARG